MGELEDCIFCSIKRDLTRMNLKISCTHLINKMTQGFNRGEESLMTFNTPATPHMGLYIINIQTRNYHTIYRRDTGVA